MSACRIWVTIVALSLISQNQCFRHLRFLNKKFNSALKSTDMDVLADELDIVDEPIGIESHQAPSFEINRRRTFAIISHPDAGKTTLTEKLLLFGK